MRGPLYARTTVSFGALLAQLDPAKLFDHLNDTWLSDEGRLQISVLLQLVSMRTITQKTGLSRSKAIRVLHLKPYLDAIK